MPEPMPEYQEGDQVTVKKGARAGQRAVITEIRRNSTQLRLRFADDRVMPYGPSEVEPADMTSYVGRKVRISSDWVQRYDKVGVVKAVRSGDVARVEFPGESGQHSYHRDHLELLDEEPRSEEVIVTATKSKWHGWRGNIKHRFSNGMVDVDFGSGNVGTIHEQHLQFTTPAVEAEKPKPVRLIGVTGHKRAGKDTFAKRLVDQHGFTRMAFADNVRKVALAIDPIVGNSLEIPAMSWRLSQVVNLGGWEFAKELPEVRQILQRIGTEGIRSLDDGFWIRQVLDHLPDGPVVITDVRFRNEADAIKAAGGIVIRVDRPGLINDDQHISESAMDDYRVDEIVQNRGTVKDLYALVDKWVADGFPTA